MTITTLIIILLLWIFIGFISQRNQKYASYITRGSYDDFSVQLLGVYDNEELARDAFYNFCASVQMERSFVEKSRPINKENYDRIIDLEMYDVDGVPYTQETLNECWDWYSKHQDLYMWNVDETETASIQPIRLNSTIPVYKTQPDANKN